MNFFEQQDLARKQSKMLLGLFGLSIATMTGFLYLATLIFLNATSSSSANCRATQPPSEPTYIASRTMMVARRGSRASGRTSGFGRSRSHTSDEDFSSGYSGLGRSSYYRHRSPYYRSNATSHCNNPLRSWWNPQVLFWVASITTLIVGGASLRKISQLREGGAVVAQELGGRLVLPEIATPQEKQLLNVVEEMAIAAGIPVPYVYVMDNESEINAFAAGYRPEDAVIGVTRGTLEQLNRDELQGVIGHEFSHILNGDMRLNIRLLAMVHGIICIYLAGRLLLYVRDDRNNTFWLFGLALMGIGGSGWLCGQLIQSAISRQREFLADASAVQFTRNPDGIASALEKIGGIGSKVGSPYAETASHMFFGNALGLSWMGNWLATHPPLLQRIEKIRGRKVTGGATGNRSHAQSTASASNQSSVMGFADPSPNTMTAEQVVAQVGTVTPEQVAHTQGLLAQIPSGLRDALTHQPGAIAVVYALFCESVDPSVTEEQMQQLGKHEATEWVEKIPVLAAEMKTLDARLRLPIVELAIPSLRQAPTTVLQTLLSTLRSLAMVDGQWSIDEFVLFLVLQRRLVVQVFGEEDLKIAFTDISQIWDDCLTVLSALASSGDTQPEAIAFSFRNGVFRLPSASQQSIPDTPPAWTLETLQTSLENLRQSAAKLKQAMVNAAAYTVLLDNTVTVQEAELLRAIAITLDCPIPPFLNAAPRR